MTTSLQSKTDKKGNIFSSSFLHVSVILVVTFLIYSNTFNSPFIFDDNMFIVNNSEIKDLINLWPPSGTRWLGFFTFAINYRIGGLNTAGYHSVNLAIHMINALLVYWLVVLTSKTPYFKRDSVLSASTHSEDKLQAMSHEPQAKSFELSTLIAFFSALLFACHPIQTQAVTYIWQRITSLATMFYLLSLAGYIQFRMLDYNHASLITHPASQTSKSTLWYVTSIVSAVLAMKTKEISFTLPLIITLYEFSFFGKTGKSQNSSSVRRFLILLPFLLTCILIPLGLFGHELKIYKAGEGISDGLRRLELKDLTTLSKHDYLLTEFRVIITYFRLLFLPINQNLDYDYPVYSSFLNAEVLISFLFLLSICMLGVYLYRSSNTSNTASRYWQRLIGFGIFWFFIALSVESSIIPINDVIFEHRLYLPSVGFFIAVTAAIELAGTRWTRVRKMLLYSLALWTVAFPVATYARNAVWKDDMRFWVDVVQKSPNKSEPHNNLGVAYAKRGYYDKAINEYKIALKISINYDEARVNLAKAYTDQGHDDKAINELTALDVNSSHPGSHNNLGVIYAKQGKIDSAINEFVSALKINPDYADARYNLGRAYADKGDIASAITEYRYALKVNPDLIDAHYNLGASYAEQGRFDEGIREFQEVLRLNPEDAEARSYLERIKRMKR